MPGAATDLPTSPLKLPSWPKNLAQHQDSPEWVRLELGQATVALAPPNGHVH